MIVEDSVFPVGHVRAAVSEVDLVLAAPVRLAMRHAPARIVDDDV